GLGEPFTRSIESGFARLAGMIAARWPPDTESLLPSLLVDGVLGGLGSVLIFLPNILLLFLAIALLEDTGYLARVAFLMDRLMHRIGLHGKSFVPLLIGFGCTVPAVLATRTLETRQARLTTILVLPLVSCAGRLPIYTMMIPCFFPESWRAPLLGLVYLLGIALAGALAKVLRLTVLRGEEAAFVLELPPYRLPTLAGVLRHMAERGWQFVRRAGTIIFTVSILLWVLGTWPRPAAAQQDRFEQQRRAIAARAELAPQEKAALLDQLDRAAARASLEQSAIGRLGRSIAPVFRPLGFDWEASTALVGALAAREVFIAQLGIVHALGETGPGSTTLRETLRARYTPLQGLSIMLFCLIGLPCLATVAVTKQETGSWKWVLGQTAGLLLLGWILTAGVYQLGRIVTG
ncbi:ferrous iron transport protein B, partial [bacterium]|nr:ferrous iron transport protein B [bacterium]